ncbi:MULTISPECIES: hypothetical protein [unclassified Amycolatopsis]|uniref:hypothetical protein n=1 Tax=unclassified Amycolatopsis TaxID=2618356 RepID=UPI002875B815|nr:MULTISPECIES: hypothetical protein [unclassified Amycolatopsis]MDS0136918.1 hypothetical protein [Amycolatopsis sp. 505]MDS0143583.1 hypothetical protein [Amycolatopsis sp. CM201R]
MSRFVKPALWTAGVLATGLLAFWLLLALDIPYQSTATPAPASPAATSEPPVPAPPAEQLAWVTDVRPGPDDRSAVLHVDLPTCAGAPHARVTEDGNRIDAEILFRPPEGTSCAQAPADFPVKTAAPIGDRPFIVNVNQTWGLVSGAWKKCDERLGCHPPADHCNPAWIAQLEFSAEAEYPGTTRACDQNWLIHDLQRHSGEPATRVAYRWAGTGWTSVAGAKGGGCGEILAAEPKFPTALCKDLQPPS